MKAYKELSPARQAYIAKQASKKGLNIADYLDSKLPAKKVYPFGKIEDSQLALVYADTKSLKKKAGAMLKDYTDEYRAQGGGIVPLTYQIIANPTEPAYGINGSDSTHEKTYVIQVGEKTVGWVQTGMWDGYLNDIYIKPEYRGWGVATRVYHKLFNEMGLTEIHIAYNRVIENVDYWSKWFSHFYIQDIMQEPNKQILIFLTKHQEKVANIHQLPPHVWGSLNYIQLVSWFSNWKKQFMKMVKRMQFASY